MFFFHLVVKFITLMSSFMASKLRTTCRVIALKVWIFDFIKMKFEFRYYWKHVLQGEPVYGADTPGSICDKSLEEFNMNHLGTVLDLLDESGVSLFFKIIAKFWKLQIFLAEEPQLVGFLPRFHAINMIVKKYFGDPEQPSNLLASYKSSHPTSVSYLSFEWVRGSLVEKNSPFCL